MSDFRSALEPEHEPREMETGNFVCLGQAVGPVLAHSGRAAELSRATESPIETMLGLALQDVLPTRWRIMPQLRWRRYRIDWAVMTADHRTIFVECDGAEFHSTPEQIERDRQRDAECRSAHITVLRFTGKEIFADAHACAWKVREA